MVNPKDCECENENEYEDEKSKNDCQDSGERKVRDKSNKEENDSNCFWPKKVKKSTNTYIGFEVTSQFTSLT